MSIVLSRAFFNRPADTVARELLNCEVCISRDGHVERYPITETEAYLGPHDLACHSSKGMTKRTEVMFEHAGTIYVYLIYGMYEMLNIVTGGVGYPAAVLIRGAGVYDGPGKLTRALGITREQNGSLLGKKAGLWIEAPKWGETVGIIATPRIGVSSAGEWAAKELRFVRKEGEKDLYT